MQEKKGSEKREVLLISFSISARFVFAIISSEEKNEDKPSSSTNEPMENEQTISVAQPLHSPNYREPIMTDGILVDDIFKAIDQLAETGECDLGTIIYHCESMRYAG